MKEINRLKLKIKKIKLKDLKIKKIFLKDTEGKVYIYIRLFKRKQHIPKYLYDCIRLIVV